MECPVCHSTNTTVDESRNELVCDDCGTLTEQSGLQLETEFEELDNGRVVAIGNIITTGELAGKKNTIHKASDKIKGLCVKLMLKKSIEAYAIEIFRTALSHGITRGRKALVTAGACVYLAARINNQSLMLLDVSDKINVNVYVLGKTYNELKYRTGQRFPDIDPALFIERFAQDLGLEDKTAEVSMTALKLLQRMKKDWISTGRRPTGITAAALLIAARMHRFDRNYEDVSRIAGVSAHTTKKRLSEWAQTSTADLTLSQFGNIEFEDEFDPPAFTNQRSEDHEPMQLTDEAFEGARREMKSLERQLDEESVTSKREKLNGSYYRNLVDSVKKGEVDMHALIGVIEGDDGDDGSASVEFEGRKELLGECLNMREVFQKLGVKRGKEEELEDVVDESEEEEFGDKLPISFKMINELTENVCEQWAMRGAEFDALIDDKELEDIFICSEAESLNNMRSWVKRNKDYYKNQKKSAERRLPRKKKEVDSGKKPRVRRQKRCYDAMIKTDKLLEELDTDLRTGGGEKCIKMAKMAVEDILEDDEAMEEDAGFDDDVYKHEQIENETYYDDDDNSDY